MEKCCNVSNTADISEVHAASIIRSSRFKMEEACTFKILATSPTSTQRNNPRMGLASRCTISCKYNDFSENTFNTNGTSSTTYDYISLHTGQYYSPKKAVHNPKYSTAQSIFLKETKSLCACGFFKNNNYCLKFPIFINTKFMNVFKIHFLKF